ncbi:putative alpha/beta-hydrolase family hydrolase [Streptomyces calvus]
MTHDVTSATTETVGTDAGPARITWHPAHGRPRLVLAVSHGAGGGIEARDLKALAARLPEHGVTVALVEQPWRVAGKKVAPAPKTLDTGWRGLWPALAAPGLPVVAGGRSAGARVACRTATELGARAVLALSFPLHPPGKPEKSRAAELLGAGVPTLVVQGGNDPFGRPRRVPRVQRGPRAALRCEGGEGRRVGVRTGRGAVRRPRPRRPETGRHHAGGGREGRHGRGRAVGRLTRVRRGE